MNDRTLPEFYIISGVTKKHDYTGELHSDMLVSQKPYRVVKGCYKGIKELAFLVYGMNRTMMLLLMVKYNQDSILYVDNERRATLLYQDGRIEYIGIFKNVSEERALREFAYTELDGRYFICE